MDVSGDRPLCIIVPNWEQETVAGRAVLVVFTVTVLLTLTAFVLATAP